MQKNLLIIILFIIGASSMILEITASKIVAPYFGNSIYTWTSLIGVILGSLSIGYLIGGKLADTKVNLRILALLILCNSILSLFIYFFSLQIFNYIFNHIHIIIIALLFSLLPIFSPPCIIFGLLFPYISKLYITSLKDSGKAIGRLYASSTLGSILGTFITGYFLLSILDSFQIILLLALILSVCSIIINRQDNRLLKYSILIFNIALLFFHSNNLYALKLFKKSNVNSSYIVKNIIPSEYANYFIIETKDPNLGTIRNLLTNFAGIQSSYVLSKPYILQSAYTRYFTLPNCYHEKNSILMIGGGGFVYSTFSLRYLPQNRITVVEIDPKLTDIATSYFDLEVNNPNLDIVNIDGRLFLNRNQNKYDAIILDAFDYNMIPFQLVTSEAISKMYSSLSSQGMVVMNIIDSLENNTNFLKSEYKTYKSIFPLVEIYQVNPDLQLNKKQNFILVAFKNANMNKKTTECIFSRDKLYNNRITINSNNNLILTDKFAPIEKFLN